MKPARKVVTRSPHRRVGYIPCSWLQPDHIAYESLLEASFVRIALLCPHLQRIRHQPLRLELGDKLGTYTPDFLLRCHGLKYLVVEVKPSDHIAKHQETLNAAKEKLHELGYEFIICTEQNIHANERAELASQILRQARSFIPHDVTSHLVEQLSGVTYPISAMDLAHKLATTVDRVMYLVGRRYLRLAPDLCTDELYYLGKGGDDHGSVSARAWVIGSTRREDDRFSSPN